MNFKPLISPRVILTPEVKYEMDLIIKHCPTEVGWFGLVERTDKFTFRITKIFLPVQKVHSATCEIDPDAIVKLAMELMDTGEDSKLRLWGHSHVNMGVSPSGQDENMFKDLHQNCNFFIRLIANKKGEYNFDVVVQDVGFPLEIEGVPYSVEYPMATNIEQRVKDTLAANVSEIKYAYQGAQHYTTGGYYQEGFFHEDSAPTGRYPDYSVAGKSQREAKKDAFEHCNGVGGFG